MLREQKADNTDRGGRRIHSTQPSEVMTTCVGDKKTPRFTRFLLRCDFSFAPDMISTLNFSSYCNGLNLQLLLSQIFFLFNFFSSRSLK